MTLLIVGMSHHTAPVHVLERATIGVADLPKVLHELVDSANVAETLVLSSCNRVEIYADVDRFHGGLSDVTGVLGRHTAMHLGDLAGYLYVHYEDAAVEHLFAVAAGLDSMVVGESQILGQLRSAYQSAVDNDAVGRTLHDVLQRALRVGKRVRTDTTIDHAGASLVSAALGQAEQVLGSLAGRPALIVGAGSTGALAAATMSRAGVGPIAVANRTYANAERLAVSVDGTALGLDDLGGALARADLVVAATGATGIVVPYDAVERAMAGRADRPLVLLDLALPHDIDPDVANIPGVAYVDMAVLNDLLTGTQADADLAEARRIVYDEVAAYLAAQRAIQVAPTVTALRARAQQVVDAELLRLDQRLPSLDPRTREEVARTIRRAVNTLLHAPTVRVKQLAEAPGGDVYAAALRELFGLDPAVPQAVTTPTATLPEEM